MAQSSWIDVAVGAAQAVEEDIVFSGDLDTGEVAADDDPAQQPAAALGIRFGLGLLEEPDGAVAEADGVGEAFHAEAMLGEPGDGRQAGDAAEGDDEMVVGNGSRGFSQPAISTATVLAVKSMPVARPIRKCGPLEKRTDGNDRVPRFEAAGPGFDEERIEDEVIVPVDEKDVGLVGAELPFERLDAIGAGIAAAEDDDAGS